MTSGWFIGDFEPTCMRTTACEVALKSYKAGDHEDVHVHRVATEITVIAAGSVTMNGRVFREGDIVILEPGEATDFQAVGDALTVVVKMPSVIGDKYSGRE